MQSLLQRLVFLVGSIFAFTSTYSQQADIILMNGKIFTSNPKQLYTQAVAIKGNRIAATGTNDQIKKLAGKNTTVIDLAGKTAVPGFNDAHYHHSPYYEGYEIEFPQDGSEPSWQQLKDSIVSLVNTKPKGTFINATMGIDVGMDSSMDRRALDQLAPDHPLLIQAYWGHIIYFNTAAIKALGMSETESDVKGGSFERYAGTNVLNGRAYEQTCNYVRLKRKTNHALFGASLQDLGKQALYFGVTTIQNMCTGASPEQYFTELIKAPLPIRFRLIRWATMKQDGSTVIPAPKLTSSHKNLALVTLSGTKWMMDGTPIERGAWYTEYYADRPGWRGKLNFSTKEAKSILAELSNRNDQPMFHAVGDSTINFLLNEMNRSSTTWSKRRVRLEHGDALLPDWYATAKKLNVIVVQNPSHFTIVPILKQRYNSYLQQNGEPVKSLLNAGIPVALGSDGPMNPYLNIMFACMHPFNPKEALTVEEAVIAYTKTAAYAELRDDKGMVAPGQLADIVVLSQDIFTVPLQQLPATHSVLTIVDGKIVFRTL